MDSVPVSVMVRFFDTLNLDRRAELRLVNKQFKEAIEYGLKQVNHISLKKPLNYIDLVKKSCSIDKYVNALSRRITVGKNFYTFINKYCGDWIEIIPDLDVCLEDLTPIASQLTIVRGKLNYKNSDWQETLKKFIKLERIYVISRITNSICNCAIAKQRINANLKVHHLVLPCPNESQSWHKDVPVRVGIRSLWLQYDDILPGIIPIITEEAVSRLEELVLFGLPRHENIPTKYPSLTKLQIIHNGQSSYEKETIYMQLVADCVNLQDLSLKNITAKFEDKLSSYLSSLTNLRQLNIEINPRSKSSSEPKTLDNNLSIVSSHLKEVTLKLFNKDSFTFASKWLESITISVEKLSKLDIDTSNLISLEVEFTKVSYDLTQLFKKATKLNYLRFKQCFFDYDILSILQDTLINMKNLKVISLRETKLLKSTQVRLNLSNNPSLMQIEIPNLVVCLDDIFERIDIVGRHHSGLNSSLQLLYNIEPRLINIEKIHGSPIKLVFNEQMTRLKSITIDLLDTELIDQLQRFCHNVDQVKIVFDFDFDLKFNPDTYNSNLCLLTDWVKSLNELKSLEGPFTQEQLVGILSNGKKTPSSLVVLPPEKITKDYSGTSLQSIIRRPRQRLLIKNELHKILLSLVEKSVLRKILLPWSCSCQDDCPLDRVRFHF